MSGVADIQPPASDPGGNGKYILERLSAAAFHVRLDVPAKVRHELSSTPVLKQFSYPANFVDIKYLHEHDEKGNTIRWLRQIKYAYRHVENNQPTATQWVTAICLTYNDFKKEGKNRRKEVPDILDRPGPITNHALALLLHEIVKTEAAGDRETDTLVEWINKHILAHVVDV